MIFIQESTSQHMSGVTSLKVSFNYNADVVSLLKQFDGVKYYDKKTHVWEFPLFALSFLLDGLTFLDDISLTLVKKDIKIVDEKVPVLTGSYKTTPFSYQLEGIKYGLNHDKWLLLDDPGLGKTLQIIYIAEELHKQRGLQHCLIICGINTLKSNWKKEIEKHSCLDCQVLGEHINSKGNVSYGSIDERAEELRSGLHAFFVITNIESFMDRRVTSGNKVEFGSPLVSVLTKNKDLIDMIVVDEIHKCKSKNSQRGNNLLKLHSKYKIGATGTLLMNEPLDAYVPLVWTEHEHASLGTFKGQYCVYNLNKELLGYKNLNLLKEELDSCSLRRTKAMLPNLPPKTIITEYVDLSSEHQKFYDNVKAGVKEEVNKVELNTSSVLALVTRLRQATVDPGILTTQTIESSKLLRCCDLVEQIVSQGEKVVIMSTFKDPTKFLLKALSKYHPLLCTGDVSEKEMADNIDLFQKGDKNKVFIATYARGATGITLNRATYMICLDECWTDAQNVQAQDRIHRVTNTWPVVIYDLIAKNTIDEHVHYLAQIKRELSDYIVDDKPIDSQVSYLKNIILDL